MHGIDPTGNTESILGDLLHVLRRWENTDSDKEHDFDAVQSIMATAALLEKRGYSR